MGGLPPIMANGPEEVYRRLVGKVVQRNVAYFKKFPEDQVKVLGEASDLQPNVTKTVDLTLAPGSYLLVCNVPGHYASGMATAITVTP